MNTFTPFMLILMLSPVRAGAGDFTRVEITSREETYAYATDLLTSAVSNPLAPGFFLPFVKLAAGSIEAVMQGCATVDVWGRQISGEAEGLDFRFESDIHDPSDSPASSAQTESKKTGIFASFIPLGAPCGPSSVQTRAGGTTGVYVSHIGTAHISGNSMKPPISPPSGPSHCSFRDLPPKENPM